MCRLIRKRRTVSHGPLPSGQEQPPRGSGGFFRLRGDGKGEKDLSWNNGSARKKLSEQQAKAAEEYRAAGMTEAQIAELAAFDMEVLRSDRRFYRHTQSLCPDGREAEEAPEPAWDGTELRLSGRMDWLQEIGDPALLEALRSLKPEMLELLTLWVFEGCSQAEIARLQRCTRQNIHGRLLRLRRYLRRRMGRAAEEQAGGGTDAE
jgi:hypothetical protein